jgi:hypothetical protein
MGRARSCGGPILALVLLVAVAPAVWGAGEVQGPTGANVSITLTVGKGKAPAERVYRFLGQDGSEARMLVGWRTPIPTTSAAQDEPGEVPAMSYIYQNVGVSANLAVQVLGQGRVALRGQIEISGAREGQAVEVGGGKAPLIGTFQQFLQVVATEGRRLRVAEAPDPEGGTVYLDIDVDVLD